MSKKFWVSTNVLYVEKTRSFLCTSYYMGPFYVLFHPFYIRWSLYIVSYILLWDHLVYTNYFGVLLLQLRTQDGLYSLPTPPQVRKSVIFISQYAFAILPFLLLLPSSHSHTRRFTLRFMTILPLHGRS